MSKAPAVDYALEIIEYFSRNSCGVGIADISNALEINKNAVSRILEALLERKWIYMSDPVSKKYRLTMKPFSLMSRSIGKDELVRIAEPILSDVHEKLGDSVYLGIRNGRKVLYLLHLDSVKEVRISGRVGGEYPLHSSAPGKILLAYDSASAAADYFSGKLERETENSIKSAKEFESEALKIRDEGYAIDNEEFGKGIICVACPIFNGEGEVIATVGVSSLTIYDTLDSMIGEKYPLLKQAAEKISESLGFRGGYANEKAL